MIDKEPMPELSEQQELHHTALQPFPLVFWISFIVASFWLVFLFLRG